MVAPGAAGAKTITISGGLPLGLTGAVSATRYVGGTASVAPTTGTFAVGDFVITQAGSVYICTVAGSPGTWVAVSGGGGAVATDAIWDAAGDLAVGTGANTAARLAAGATSGHVLTSNGPGAAPSWQAAAGGGASWTQGISESGASFANFTANSGTWSSNGTEIIQTDTSGVTRRARHITLVPSAFGLIVEVEANILTAGPGNVRAGIVVGDSVNGGQLWVYIERLSTGQVAVEREAAVQIKVYTQTISSSTWYKLRVIYTGATITVYLDGALLGTTLMNAGEAEIYPCIATYGASVKFRNFKVWTLSGGLPA